MLCTISGIDRQFGVMFYGRGSEDIFSGTDYEVGMTVAEINLDDFEQLMGTLFPFRGDPNRPKVDNVNRTVLNPNVQDRAKNFAKALSDSPKLVELYSKAVNEYHRMVNDLGEVTGEIGNINVSDFSKSYRKSPIIRRPNGRIDTLKLFMDQNWVDSMNSVYNQK